MAVPWLLVYNGPFVRLPFSCLLCPSNLDPSSDMQWYPKEAIIADLLISRFFQHQFNAAHRIDYDSMLLGDDATSRDIVYLFTF